MKLFLRPSHPSPVITGNAAALSAALKEHHGMALPKTGQATGRAGARAIWAGPSVFLLGPEPHADLSNHAAIVDQSDSWCVLNLKGADVEAVLARLSSVDMRLEGHEKGAGGAFPAATYECDLPPCQ
jgi:sarcosine oxidase subunit gamma